MKYVITLHHYVSGSGYQYSEQVETGTIDELFTAEEYTQNMEIDDEENAWTEVEVEFFEDDADPAFDNPIYKSVTNETIAGKF